MLRVDFKFHLDCVECESNFEATTDFVEDVHPICSYKLFLHYKQIDYSKMKNILMP